VQHGSALALPFEDDSFGAVLCLDVLEHIALLDQTKALREIGRVLAGEGRLLLSLPNLAHLHSRINFMLRGRLTRTSAIERHPGDRPIGEYIELLRSTGFELVSKRGIFPTAPFFFRLINRRPARFGWMVAVLDRILPIPSLCFLVLVEARLQRLFEI
jgi:SAM-dependent methyltransferase